MATADWTQFWAQNTTTRAALYSPATDLSERIQDETEWRRRVSECEGIPITQRTQACIDQNGFGFGQKPMGALERGDREVLMIAFALSAHDWSYQYSEGPSFKRGEAERNVLESHCREWCGDTVDGLDGLASLAKIPSHDRDLYEAMRDGIGRSIARDAERSREADRRAERRSGDER